MLPLIWRDSVHAFREVILEIEEPIQETLKLVKFADIYAVSKLVKEFDERSKPLDGGFDFRLEDFDTVFTLDFPEVD
jgi:hypothetical protein